MSPITFKFFTPRGDCRRVTYEDVPELATINELVDGMVEGRRSLSYRDSEGDVVLLKTSRDVVEAVKDANDSGVKSIKVQIRLVRECPRKNGSNAATAATANSSNNNNRNHCGNAWRRANYHRFGPQWGRCWSRGLFGHPHRINIDLDGISEEVEEICKHFAPFFGIHVNDTDDNADQAEKEAKKEPGERESSVSGTRSPKDDEHPPVSQSEETSEKVQDTKEAVPAPANPVNEPPAFASPSPVPTIEENVVAGNSHASASGFTFVESEPQNDDETEDVEAKQKAKDENDDQSKPGAMEEKLKLLKEMGFEIPQDVARNMIRELNGRMDLIVRALVANQK